MDTANEHEIFTRLEERRNYLGLTRREYAVNQLGVTEDTYSNWKRKFPSRPNRRTITAIANELGLTLAEVKNLM